MDTAVWTGPWRQILDLADGSWYANEPGALPPILGEYAPVPFLETGSAVIGGQDTPCNHRDAMCPACEGAWFDYAVRTFQEHGPVGYLAGCRCRVCAPA